MWTRTGPSTILMEPCWPQCTNYVRIFSGWKYSSVFTDSSAPSTQQAANCRKLLGQKYTENRRRILTCIFEGITTLWNYSQLDLFPTFTKCFEQLRHNWSPIFPKFDMDLVPGFFSQNITKFSIQQFNAQPHNRCSFSTNFSDSTPILLQQSSTYGLQHPAHLQVRETEIGNNE